jgi:hypothetical protein
MYLSEQIQKKWEGVLDHPDLPAIKDPYRKAVTAVVLENQATEMMKSQQMLGEAPTNVAGTGGFGGGAAAAGPVAGFDPILISLVRRSLPNLIAYDICGVQPMTGPTGLIFAMRSAYSSQNVAAGAAEAFYNEANTSFAGQGAQQTLAVGALRLLTLSLLMQHQVLVFLQALQKVLAMVSTLTSAKWHSLSRKLL